jgi:hypothetical protein
MNPAQSTGKRHASAHPMHGADDGRADALPSVACERTKERYKDRRQGSAAASE